MFYPINAFEPGVNKVLDDKCFRRLNIFLTQERKYSCYKKLGNVKFDAWLLALLRGEKILQQYTPLLPCHPQKGGR